MHAECRRAFVLKVAAGLGAAAVPRTLPAAPQAPSTRDVLDHYFRAVQARELDRVVALFTPEARYEDVTFQFAIEGPQAIRQMFSSAFSGLAEPVYQLRRSVVEADRAAAEWVAEGRHAGPMLGVEATGRRLQVRGLSFLEIRQGRIRSVTDYLDRIGLETQLGLHPR